MEGEEGVEKKVTLKMKISHGSIPEKRLSGGKKREMSKLSGSSVKFMDFSQQRVLEKRIRDERQI